MNRLPQRLVFALIAASGITFLTAAGLALAGCNSCKKEPPPAPVDLTPPPPADAGVVQIAPLDDAGDAAPETGGPPKAHGGGAPSNPNAARIRQCCNAIRHEAKNLGTSPEAVLMVGVAAQCDMVAAQVAGGSAPEFGQVRQMLKGRVIPAACSGM